MLEKHQTMFYATDSFSFEKKALLKSRDCWDLSDETSAVKFEISGTEPAGTNRRVILYIDGSYYRFVNATLDLYDDRLDVDSILKHGNSVGELLALNEDSLASLLGKKIYPWIAMSAPADSPVMPSIKMALRVNCFNDRYVKTETSPIYELKRTGDACRIADILASKYTNGHAKANIKCTLKNPVTGWGDWIELEAAKFQLATAVQFQVQYILTTLDGSDFAQVDNIIVNYTTDSDKLSGDTTEIVTLAQEYYSDLGTCYALIKTGELIDCDLRAFVLFDVPVENRIDVPLGNATGAVQILPLMFNGVLDKNILADTIRMTAGGKTFSGFFFDTKESTVTFTAKAGEEIAVSYNCGANDELWREMELDFSRTDEGIYSHRFIYRLSATDSKNKKVSAVKFRLTKNSSRVENQTLGVGTGREQTFYLPHHAKAESIRCTGDWKYFEEAQILKVVAPIDVDIHVSYDWVAQLPEVNSVIVGWEAKI